MALEQLLNEIDELKDSIQYTRRFSRELEVYKGRLIESISRAEQLLKSLREEGRITALSLNNILDTVKEGAKFIIEEEILNAVSSNREFGFPRFLEALTSVAQNPELLDIKLIGADKNPSISVKLRFYEVAGNLADWARGVEDTRAELKVSRGIDADRASRIWRDTIYQKGPYDNTIKLRIENSTKPAAFWQLLDKGTTSLASDRGGFAYPSYSTPTNFVDKAETRIENSFKSLYKEYSQRSNQQEQEVQREITLAREYIALIDRIVDEITTELEENKRLYSRFSKVATYVDQNKLDDVLVRIRKNLDIETTAEGRIELGVSSRRRYRPYLSRLRSLVGE